MNNHHRISKRKRQAILFFTYGFMTLAVVSISILCILFIMGFRFDITDRTIEQGGLLQFRSTPAGARVILNDRQLSAVTPTKRDVAVGNHSVTMQRQGYKSWSRDVTIKAGELRWLNYARLIPEELVTRPVLELGEGLRDAKATPDRRYLAVIEAAAQPTVRIVDLSNDESLESRTISMTPELLTVTEGQPSELSVVEWDFGSRFLLFVHRSGETTEYIRLDRTAADGALRNITKEFNLPFRDMHFSGTSGNVLYAVTNNDLRRVDTSAGSVTQPLVAGVQEYRLYRENDIAFVALRGDSKVAGVYLDDKETIVRTEAADVALSVDVSRYYSNYYLAVKTDDAVDIIKDPVEVRESATAPHATIPRSSHVFAWLDFNSSGRFVISGDDTAYSVYDIETDELHTVTQPLQRAHGSAPIWLDDYYLSAVRGDTISLLDYDGKNVSDVTKIIPTLPVFLSPDGTFLYSFAANEATRALQSTRLILED